MTTTTTIKIPGELKERVAAAAQASGKSTHAFMVEAIEKQTELAERRRSFVTTALQAEQEVAQYGLVHDGDEVLAYLKSRLEGARPARPQKRRL